MSVSAGLIWTSQLLLMMRDGRTTEFCSVLNRILRELDDDLMPDACVIIRAINSLCILRYNPSKLVYPTDGMTYHAAAACPCTTWCSSQDSPPPSSSPA